MYNNFYIRFNYKNIIPFNLKKKKLRVHANIIGSKTTNLYGFFIGGEIKFWYYYFGINGLKRDSVFLVKKFLNKKLGVFFISNFNMIEGKWSFPKIYEQYYKNYLFLKKKKMNLLRYNLILNNNIFFLNNIFNINNINNINIVDIFKLHYINNNNIFSNKNIVNNSYNLYKFKKKYKLPLLFRYNNNKIYKINLSNSQRVVNSDEKKTFTWNWNFYLKQKLFKKKKESPLKKNVPFWLLKKKSWYYQQQSNLLFKQKLTFLNNKNYLNNFYLKKNIINIIQFVKINKAIYKINKKNNMLFLFYMFYLHFNFIKLYKIKKKKIKKNKILLKFLNKKKYIINLINKIKYSKKKNNNIINIKLKKKSLNWIKFIFYKNLNKDFDKKKFIIYYIKLKKKIKKLYKYKLINKNYLILKSKNNNFLNKNYLMYYQLSKMWFKYNKIKKRKKINRLNFLKNVFKKKFKKKYNYKNLYLLWLYYIVKRQYK